MSADRLGQGSECGRRDSHVVDQLGPTAYLLLRLRDHIEKASGVVCAESISGKEKASAHLLPRSLGGPWSELLQSVLYLLLKLLIGGLTTTLGNHSPVLGKKAGDGQAVKGGQNQPTSQVTRGSEQHKDHRRWSGSGIHHGPRCLSGWKESRDLPRQRCPQLTAHRWSVDGVPLEAELHGSILTSTKYVYASHLGRFADRGAPDDEDQGAGHGCPSHLRAVHAGILEWVGGR